MTTPKTTPRMMVLSCGRYFCLLALAIGGALLPTAPPTRAQPSPPEPLRAAAVVPPLEPGDKGPPVKRLQLDLAQWGLYKGVVDGVYGAETVAAVRSLQQQQGLPVDGLTGAQTWQILEPPSRSGADLMASLPTPALGTAIITFTPIVVAQPAPPPSALWLALMPLVPITGGALTYLHRQLQGQQRVVHRYKAPRPPRPRP